MANPLNEFNFAATWLDSGRFPTYEPDETRVREDLQALHDETRNWINTTLRPVINALIEAANAAVTDITVNDEGNIALTLSNGSTRLEGPVLPTSMELVKNITYDPVSDLWTITYHSGQVVTFNGFRHLLDIPDLLSDLTEDETHRVVTDAEKEQWNAAMPQSGGAFTGAAKAGTQTPSDCLIRNSKLVFSEEEEPTVEGEIFWLCE